MSITRLPEIVFPLTQINKVNEIVDVLNDNLNMYYSATNPALTPVEGVATWTVTHNLGTENVNCSLYNGDNLVISNVSITSDNVITISINSDSNIAQDTYKIVVISNGAGSASGSGSYVLPTASTTTLGGVRIDGSSITINNGVISSTVDSTLSSTSENPVQNKVIYPSLNGFLPSGTIINVKTDGSGDFTSLIDAINYLTGKWSNGTVTIFIADGTYSFPNTISIDSTKFNFMELIITGSSYNNLTLQRPVVGGVLMSIGGNGTSIRVQNVTLAGTYSSTYVYATCIHSETGANVTLYNVKAQDTSNILLSVGENGTLILKGDIIVSHASFALFSNNNGKIEQETTIALTAENIGTLLYTLDGGSIVLPNVTLTRTNVTKILGNDKNKLTDDGYILTNLG